MNPTNELKPLVTEYRMQDLWDYVIKPMVRKLEKQQGPCSTAWQAGELGREVIKVYEVDRANTHALVQQLVDALEATKHKPDWWRHHPSEEWIYDVIADAAEQGFKPFQP